MSIRSLGLDRYADRVPLSRPPFVTMLRRAAMLQCAWCGNRPGFLRGWFHRHGECQHCGLSVQRGEDGFELGAATVNVMFTLGALIVAAAIPIVVTYPQVDAGQLIAVLGVVAVILPIVLYPFSFTIWFAVELLMDPPSVSALVAADRWIADNLALNA